MTARASSAPSHQCSQPWWGGSPGQCSQSALRWAHLPPVSLRVFLLGLGPSPLFFCPALTSLSASSSGPGALSSVPHPLGSQASSQGVLSESLPWFDRARGKAWLSLLTLYFACAPKGSVPWIPCTFALRMPKSWGFSDWEMGHHRSYCIFPSERLKLCLYFD